MKHSALTDQTVAAPPFDQLLSPPWSGWRMAHLHLGRRALSDRRIVWSLYLGVLLVCQSKRKRTVRGPPRGRFHCQRTCNADRHKLVPLALHLSSEIPRLIPLFLNVALDLLGPR
jgi:hypothetical protein